ncbi:ABC transporter ATP-binding protein [Vibrio rotiferianus]|jgi:ATP-binding cassette subfamily C protein|uniref:ABC transporter ATP-binding protein n=1 Tax=Vibrio rotiferianus TaxID=190895 RepID=UPI0011104C88|nr:ABC transporter ATP-binding protein [Vibrio rotiferianus]TMX35803.1 ABC transporter ATP-binding protein [Vibrio rotiferianus]TMX46952.1 ABC transporter ATP-binding protein [Vibrio rotiferianus]TMX62741.1 ABC transporter ATP-binding protein [Vibrio rotiferianus]CAH1595986.1 ABC-type multidrug transport system, ATPase and permease component [Vibrio rotiferianus]CAH1596607.1 ABC-type multidrug transport system, ATPase and permease component [Vibrio rotiferianus]
MTSRNDTISRSWLITQAKKHKSKLALANFIAVLATLISVPIPLLMPLMVDEVLLDKPASGLAAMNLVLPEAWHTPTGYIFFTLFLVVLMRAASQALNIVQSRQFTLVSKTITYGMRSKMIDKLGRISIRQYETKGSGGINAHLITDIETIDKFIGSTLAKFVISLLTVIGTAIILLWLDWRLGLFILLVNPIVIYFSRKLGSTVKHLKRKENHSFEVFQNRLVETLDGIYQLRAANKEREFLQQLKFDADQIRIDADKYAWQSEAAGRVSFLLFLIGFELFRAVAMLMVMFSDLTIGQIFAVFGYLWFMLSPVQELLGIQFSWYSAKAALKRINDLLELEEEHRPVSKVNPFNKGQEVDVKIENVDFSYNSEIKVLDNLSLHIPPGKKVALVGASGGGKSTLIQLLIGVYRQNSGNIRFNDELSEDISFDVIRNKIAVVLQQPILFNDTLRHNLTLGGDFDELSLWRALEVAQLQDVMKQLDNGLNTQIGRNGIRLSGGQRQRLAIARMVLSDPQFVILDEATSALDTATEAALHKALTEFLNGRTTLIVAHRLSAVKQADLIYVLEDGKVTQSGTHGELVEQEGLYQTLYGGVQSHV